MTTTETTADVSDAATERAHECAQCEEHESVSAAKRDTVLDEYSSKCQTCGRRGPREGGLATLDVHHIERAPDDCGEHDVENLTLLCRPCHIWHHNQTDPAEAPVEITEADRTRLLPQDIEILRLFADHGPMRTGVIAEEIVADLNVSSVRERLWVVMGLDNLIDERDEQIVDKDVETGEWGLAGQIENSARGHIPEDPQLLLQRAADERVRRALERGCSRSDVVDVLDVSKRSTFYKHKRAAAYDFPLDAFSRGGRPTTEKTEEDSEGTSDDREDEQQQRLNTLGSGDGKTETWGSESGDATLGEETASVEDIEQKLDVLIDVLSEK